MHAHAHVNTHAHTHTRTRTCAHTSTYTRMHTQVHTHACTHTNTAARTHARTPYTHTYTHIHTLTHTCMHTCAHAGSQARSFGAASCAGACGGDHRSRACYARLHPPQHGGVCVCVCTIPQVIRDGQNCTYTSYMTVYLVISLPKIPYMHPIYTVYIWFWPTLQVMDATKLLPLPNLHHTLCCLFNLLL